MKVMFVAGGTGGHINPAVAVATELKRIEPDCEILFVGTEGRMETQIVPKAGFPIKTVKMNIIIPKIWMFAGSCKKASSKFFMQTIVAYFRAKDAARLGGAQSAWVPP